MKAKACFEFMTCRFVVNVRSNPLGYTDRKKNDIKLYLPVILVFISIGSTSH